MLIARVIGDVVATQKHSSYEASKVLLVQPLDLDGSERGDALVALDAVGAGVGNTVLITTDGYAAFTSVGKSSSPIDAAVLGVVDKIDLLLDFDAAPAPAS